ncbi:lamin tail domain-containing protein, partial [bacterium]|nr:lamin tail domain-containing protein [bacterium]
MHLRILLITLCCLPTLVSSLRGEVVINEVLFDPEGADTDLEWVELLNNGSSSIDLRDYLLDADGPNFLLPEYLLLPGDILVVHTNFTGIPYVDAGHMYLYNPDHNLGNTHGFVGLWRPNEYGQVAEFFVSYVEYGAPNQTWESQAVTAEIWYEDEFVPDVAAGHSLHWDGNGIGAAFWFDDASPVPGVAEELTEVMLVSFVAGMAGNGIQLHWSSGFTGSHFSIRRAEAPALQLEEIATIAPRAGTGSPLIYSWMDDDITPGRAYNYQLSGIDANGQVLFQSAVTLVTTSGPGAFRLLNNHPNPFNSSTHIRFQLFRQTPVDLVIYNTLGQTVRWLLQGEELA